MRRLFSKRRILARFKRFAPQMVNLWVLILAGTIGMGPRHVFAESGKFFETIGVSTVVGAVLGASTLPFYEQPGDHIGNIGLGLAAGAAAGLGILLYGVMAGSSDDSEMYGNLTRKPILESSTRRNDANVDPQNPAKRSVTLSMPLVSLSW